VSPAAPPPPDDSNDARKADQTGSRISEIGKYVGTFTQAEDLTAASGTKGVGFRFEANGQSANLSLYTTKTDGTKLMGYQALMAIMTCMKLRGIAPKPGTVKHWDNEARQEVSKQAQIFPELCGPRIGLLLQPADRVEDVAADLHYFQVIAVNFPKFVDGRGYSTAALLRQRYQFAGELRAVGDVLHDQLFYMRRVGFDAYALRRLAGEDGVDALYTLLYAAAYWES
jgi:hypothetical protein